MTKCNSCVFYNNQSCAINYLQKLESKGLVTVVDGAHEISGLCIGYRNLYWMDRVNPNQDPSIDYKKLLADEQKITWNAIFEVNENYGVQHYLDIMGETNLADHCIIINRLPKIRDIINSIPSHIKYTLVNALDDESIYGTSLRYIKQGYYGILHADARMSPNIISTLQNAIYTDLKQVLGIIGNQYFITTNVIWGLGVYRGILPDQLLIDKFLDQDGVIDDRNLL